MSVVHTSEWYCDTALSTMKFEGKRNVGVATAGDSGRNSCDQYVAIKRPGSSDASES
jgi:hypothetical protein